MSDLVTVEEIQILAEESEDSVLAEQVEIVEILAVAEQGPPGPPGPAGQGGASYLEYAADGPLGGHRVVRATSTGKVGYVDPSDPDQVHAAIGLTVGAATSGAPVHVQFSGAMNEPSWSWTPNRPIFIGAAGVPTQTPPPVGFHAPIGVAVSPTSMVVQIKTPVVL